MMYDVFYDAFYDMLYEKNPTNYYRSKKQIVRIRNFPDVQCNLIADFDAFKLSFHLFATGRNL